MSLPLPPEFWPLQPDDVVVLIEGVAFIETKEEAARLVAEGRATYLSRRVATATRKCAVPDLPAVASVLVAV